MECNLSTVFFHLAGCIWIRCVAVCIGSLLFLSSIPLFVYRSPVEGHLDCFQFGVIMNKATINIHEQLFV